MTSKRMAQKSLDPIDAIAEIAEAAPPRLARQGLPSMAATM